MLVGSAAMLVALSLSGCFAQETPDATSSPSPSTTPVFASEEEALAAATEAYENYLKVSDEISDDGGANAERLREVATEEQYQREVVDYQELINDDIHTVGETFIDSVSIQSFDASPEEGDTSVTLYACVDVSGIELFDDGNNNITPRNRVNRISMEATFDWYEPRLLMSGGVPWAGDDFCN